MNNLYTVFALLVTIAVAIAYFNHRYIKLQMSIALMVGSLSVSIISIVISHFGSNLLREHITTMISHLHFHDLLINGMLSFLLFAGALNIELPSLKQHKWLIATLASISTIASTLLIATAIYYIFLLFGHKIPFSFCFLFGALISPTDPIAVLAMCNDIKAPQSLKSILGGESLFNDGVGIVLFLLALHIIIRPENISGSSIFYLFCQQSIGGIVYGLVIGLIGYYLMRPIEEPKLRVSITIAIVGSLSVSIISIVISHFGSNLLREHITTMISHLHFHDLLINGMLSFLLFAGALNIELPSLKQHKWLIATLASISTIASTLLIATAIYYIFLLFGHKIPFSFCFLFGALISPTDPIAVLAMCNDIKAPQSLKSILGGESLFNDGVGIVLFLLALHIIIRPENISGSSIFYLFCQQSIGGIVYGLVIGLIGYYLMRPIEEPKLRVSITIAIVTGGYALAETLHISAPLAMVCAGITIGNGFHKGHYHFPFLKEFWSMLDEFLNAILFLIIGFEILILNLNYIDIIISILAIIIVLATRAITVYVPMHFFNRKNFPKNTTSILIWGGLRGGLAIALSLSIPTSAYRDALLTMTYAIVAFSIIIQGMTIKPLLKETTND